MATLTRKTQIANLALQHLGSSKVLVDVDSDKGVEARTFLGCYVIERDATLRGFPWSFASAYVDLALRAGDGTTRVNPDWFFAYDMPESALAIRRIVTALGRRDPCPPPFSLGSYNDPDDGFVKVLFCNLEGSDDDPVTVEITRNCANDGGKLTEDDFDPLFVSAFSWRLAAAMAPALSRVAGAAETCMKAYLVTIAEAQVAALNEGQAEPDIDSPSIRARF